MIAERLAVVENLFHTRAEQAGVNLRLVQTGQEDLNQVISDLTSGLGADDVIVAVGVAVVYPHRAAGEILQVNRWTGADEKAYLIG